MLIYKEGESALDTLGELGSFLAGDEQKEKPKDEGETKETEAALGRLQQEVDEERDEGKTDYKEDLPDLFTGSAEEGGLPSNGTDLYSSMEAEAPAEPEPPTKEINESREPTASQEPQEAPTTTEEGKDVFTKVGDAMRGAPGMAKEAIMSAGTAAVEAGKGFLKSEAKTTDKPKSEREKLTQEQLDRIVKDAKEGNTEAQARLKEIRRAYQERVAKRERQGGQSATDAATNRLNNQVASREYTGPMQATVDTSDNNEPAGYKLAEMMKKFEGKNVQELTTLLISAIMRNDVDDILTIDHYVERDMPKVRIGENPNNEKIHDARLKEAKRIKEGMLSSLGADQLNQLIKLTQPSGVEHHGEISFNRLAKNKLDSAKTPEPARKTPPRAPEPPDNRVAER